MIKTKPEDIWREHAKIHSYLEKNEVYADVKQNELFYEGKQWEGLPSSDMPRPVINVLQRAINYMVASLSSNEVAVNITPFSPLEEDKQKMKVISGAIENEMEQARTRELSRECLRDGGVDGAGYMHHIFDPEVETGQAMKGAIRNELVSCTNMEFGNPYSNDIQSQPYIIIVLRQDVNQLKLEAEELGLSQEEIDQIVPDNETDFINDDSDNLVTVLLKYYKVKNPDTKEKTVWFTKCTKNITLKEPTDLGYFRYPISCFGWSTKKNSYLYTAPMTAVIQNQIFINKTVAMEQMMVLNNAFPRNVYDKSKIDLQEYMNTNAIAVSGLDIAGKFMDFIQPVEFSNQAPQVVNDTIAQTKDTMGVTDVQLGNVKPENTSAIITLEENASVPLEIQKQHNYIFWEDIVRNMIDIMANQYGKRIVMSDEFGIAEVDFSVLRTLNYIIRVEVGAGAQYSQVAQINTLDKYLDRGLIPGSVHAKLTPSKFLMGKDELVRSMQEAENMQAQALASGVGQ